MPVVLDLLEALTGCLQMHLSEQTKISRHKNRESIKKTLSFATYHSEVGEERC